MEQREIRFDIKRDPGTIIKDSFYFLRSEFKPLSRLIFTYVFPLIILYGVGSVLFQMKFPVQFDLTTDNEQLLKELGPYYINFLLFSLFGIFIQALYAGAFYTYIEAYLKFGKGNFKISDISHELFTNSLLALGAGFISFVITVFGLILCIVPGIYYANCLSLAIFIAIVEKKGIGNALIRSFQLVNTKWWETFLINLVGLGMIIVLSIFLSIPSSVAGLSEGLFAPAKNTVDEFPQWYLVLSGITTVITSLSYIVLFTFYVFVYFNLRKYNDPPRQVNPE
jgi:hypothetical protein